MEDLIVLKLTKSQSDMLTAILGDYYNSLHITDADSNDFENKTLDERIVLVEKKITE